MGYKVPNVCNLTRITSQGDKGYKLFLAIFFVPYFLSPFQLADCQYLASKSCKVTKLHGFLTELSESMQNKTESCAV